jgi:hypothetical protein
MIKAKGEVTHPERKHLTEWSIPSKYADNVCNK